MGAQGWQVVTQSHFFIHGVGGRVVSSVEISLGCMLKARVGNHLKPEQIIEFCCLRKPVLMFGTRSSFRRSVDCSMFAFLCIFLTASEIKPIS